MKYQQVKKEVALFHYFFLLKRTRKKLYQTKNKKKPIYPWWSYLQKSHTLEQECIVSRFDSKWGDILTRYMNVFNSLLIRSNLCTLYRQVYQEVKNKTSILKRKLRYFIIIFSIKKKKERGFTQPRIKESYLPVMELFAEVR